MEALAGSNIIFITITTAVKRVTIVITLFIEISFGSYVSDNINGRLLMIPVRFFKNTITTPYD